MNTKKNLNQDRMWKKGDQCWYVETWPEEIILEGEVKAVPRTNEDGQFQVWKIGSANPHHTRVNDVYVSESHAIRFLIKAQQAKKKYHDLRITKLKERLSILNG